MKLEGLRRVVMGREMVVVGGRESECELKEVFLTFYWVGGKETK